MIRYIFLFFLLFSFNSWSKNCLELLSTFHSKQKNVAPLLDIKSTYNKLYLLQKNFPEHIKLIKYGESEGEDLIALKVFHNPEQRKKYRIIISSGVHGNEPMGVITALNFLEVALNERNLFKEFEFTFIPMVNPTGLMDNTRRTRAEIDLNRSFAKDAWVEASLALKNFMEKDSDFDMAIDLHGANTKNEFFVIMADEDKGLAKEALKSIDDKDLLFPKDNNDEKSYLFPAKNGPYTLFSPGESLSKSVGTLKTYFNTLGIPYSYTLEYPGTVKKGDHFDYMSPQKQVKMMTHIVRSLLYSLQKAERSPQSVKCQGQCLEKKAIFKQLPRPKSLK